MSHLFCTAGRDSRHRRAARGFPIALAMMALMALVFFAPTAHARPRHSRGARRHRKPSPVQTRIRRRSPLSGWPIAKIEIIGNRRSDKSLILNQIRVLPGQSYHLAQVKVDVRSIASLGRFITVRADVIPTRKHTVIVRYIVRERPVIGEIQITGNRHFTDAKLMQLILARVGGSVDPFVFRTDERAIERMYRNDGYSFVKVTVDKKLLRKGIVRYQIVEGPPVRVTHIVFVGDKSLAKWYLSFKIHTSTHFWFIRRGVLNKNTVAGDTAIIRNIYVSHGFLDARVSYFLHYSLNMHQVTVQFVIDQGPRYRIGTIKIVGNHAVPTARIQKLITIKTGDYWNRKLIAAIQKRIAHVYGHLGYIYSHVTPDFAYSSRHGIANLTFKITEGKTYRVGRVIIRGNPQLQDHVIRREIRIYPGSLYDTVEADKSKARLQDLQLFGRTAITPIGHQPSTRDALVDVTPENTARFMVGAGVSSNSGLIGQVSVDQRNFDITDFPRSLGEFMRGQAFKGGGQYFRILLEPGTTVQAYRVTFTEPYLYDSPYSFNNDAYYFQTYRESYEEGRLGDRVTFGRRFGDIYTVTLGLRAEEVSVTNIYDAVGPGYQPNQDDAAPVIFAAAGGHFLTSITPAIVRDTTDSTIFPTTGTRTVISLEQYGAMGGEYTFTKINADFDYFTPIYTDPFGRKTVFSWRNQLGFIPWGKSVFFERFYGGGLGSLRGFKYRGVSPRSGYRNDPIGGNFLAITTAEVNYPIYQNMIRGVVFVDAGVVNRSVYAGVIRVDAGVGLRLTLPFFGAVPLAIDLAIPINRAHGDNTQYVSFSIGTPF